MGEAMLESIRARIQIILESGRDLHPTSPRRRRRRSHRPHRRPASAAPPSGGRAATGRIVSQSKSRRGLVIDVSTASRDFRALVDHECLTAQGETKARYYNAADKLTAVHSSIRATGAKRDTTELFG